MNREQILELWDVEICLDNYSAIFGNNEDSLVLVTVYKNVSKCYGILEWQLSKIPFHGRLALSYTSRGVKSWPQTGSKVSVLV